MCAPYFSPQRIKKDNASWRENKETLKVEVEIRVNDPEATYQLSDCTLTIDSLPDELPPMVVRQERQVSTYNGTAMLVFRINESNIAKEKLQELRHPSPTDKEETRSIARKIMRELRNSDISWNLAYCELKLESNNLEGYSETWLYTRPFDHDGILEWEWRKPEHAQSNV